MFGEDVTDEDLLAALQKAGPIASANVVYSPEGANRGFGFVEFLSPLAVPIALKMTGITIKGRRVRISRAGTDRRERR